MKPDMRGVSHLSNRLVLSFTGADRLRYLNGQVTANLSSAALDTTLPACVTTAKGRLCGEVMVTMKSDRILVDADGALAETLPPRMERYIVADDVVMEDISSSVSIIHAIGLDAAGLAEIGATPIPANRFGIAGHDFYIPSSQFTEAWKQLSADALTLSPQVLETLRIEKGVPRWGFELDETTLPPEAGLDRTHIDYQKGCYIGQEVISRIKSVGHVNRQLTGFVSTDNTPLAPGSVIFPADAPEAILGNLTSCTRNLALDAHIALGYLKRNSPVTGLMAAAKESPDAPVRITINPLPFL